MTPPLERMKAEGGRMKGRPLGIHFILHPSAFILFLDSPNGA
jgi:hypothetical protein